MAIVRINTSDTAWIDRRGIDAPVAAGTDATGTMFFTTTVRVPGIERTTFAAAKMIRFDLGTDAPRDHSRWGMYPESYLVDAEDGDL